MKESIENFLIVDLIKVTQIYLEGEPTEKLTKLKQIIVKQDLKYGIDFHDAITNKTYSEYRWYFKQTGEKVIKNKIPLSKYINTLAEEVKDIEFLSNRINNIIVSNICIISYLNSICWHCFT